jgi:hypothetical protein
MTHSDFDSAKHLHSSSNFAVPLSSTMQAFSSRPSGYMIAHVNKSCFQAESITVTAIYHSSPAKWLEHKMPFSPSENRQMQLCVFFDYVRQTEETKKERFII